MVADQRQTLVNSGITNDDGSVWGLALISAAAGTNVDVTPTATQFYTNDDYTFQVQVLKTKEDWQKEVEHEIDADSGVQIENYQAGNGFLNNRNNLLAVFNFYGKLFDEQPDEFYWCGLAKLVGAPVYAGLSDAEYAKVGTLEVGTVNGSLIVNILTTAFLEPKMDQFQQIMIQMNIDIFNDMAWQFEAYKNGGLNALKVIAAIPANRDEIDIGTWEEIDDGIKNINISKIQEGNQLLAQREQQITVAQDYQKLQNLLPNTGIFSSSHTNTVGFIVSYLGQNPIVGGPNFWNFEPFGADLTVFNDRWDWTTRTGTGINQGIIPLWLAESDNTRSLDASQSVMTRALQFSYVYQWLALPLY